jgi:branched-chain amino acid transport system ATP-binding protein
MIKLRALISGSWSLAGFLFFWWWLFLRELPVRFTAGWAAILRTKAFGGVKAVIDVSFKLQDGQLLAMIGPNGAGKSTCFNLINGQLRPDQGNIIIMGKTVNGSKPRDVWKLGVGRTFQITSTFGSMTVLENVQMALLSYHRRTKSILKKISQFYVDESMAMLELLGIGDQAINPSCC